MKRLPAFLVLLAGGLAVAGCNPRGTPTDLVQRYGLEEADSLLRSQQYSPKNKRTYSRSPFTEYGRRLLLGELAKARMLKQTKGPITLGEVWRFYSKGKPIGPWFVRHAGPPSVPGPRKTVAVWLEDGQVKREMHYTRLMSMLDVRRRQRVFTSIDPIVPSNEERIPKAILDLDIEAQRRRQLKALELQLPVTKVLVYSQPAGPSATHGLATIEHLSGSIDLAQKTAKGLPGPQYLIPHLPRTASPGR